ncbi:MAG: metal-dependent hydrolase [Planctomycetota bacterium]|nr:metal-dependent hydrolase [Planctomycetota bacterium]
MKEAENDSKDMADFRSHMTVSTLSGVALGVAGAQYGMPIETCLIAGGLCSVSGMLPDLDSDSGRPLREATTLLAALVPMLMVDRLQRFNLSHEWMVVVAGGVYIFVRFILAEIFRRYTVHRGMWHSIPAAVTVGMVAFLVISCEDFNARLFKTSGVVLGFMSHLILDEIWAIDFRGGKFRFKKSFGTAIKLWGIHPWANYTTYAKLAIACFLVYEDEALMTHFGFEQQETTRTAMEFISTFLR